MKKQQIVTEKVEVVKQVRLTSKQRLQLVSMQNEGGRVARGCIDWNVKTDLLALGLIEERESKTADEKRALNGEITAAWKAIPALVKAKDAEAVDRLIDKIKGSTRELGNKTWWLTSAAEEYLTKGKVTIVR